MGCAISHNDYGLATIQTICHPYFANTVQCCYNAVNSLLNPHKTHPHKTHQIAHPLVWGIGCFVWFQILIDILIWSLHWCIQYHVILDCSIAALIIIILCNIIIHVCHRKLTYTDIMLQILKRFKAFKLQMFWCANYHFQNYWPIGSKFIHNTHI